MRTQPRVAKTSKAVARKPILQKQLTPVDKAAKNEAPDALLSRQDFISASLTEETEPQVLKTRDQIAARYQVSVRTVDYWRENRILPYYKRGGVVRFHPAECDAAIKSFRTKSRWEDAAKEEGEEV